VTGARVSKAARHLLALAGILAAVCAEAARPAVRNYDLRDGLPQTQVTALAQDQAGFLWIGTLTGGVGRYDGRHWRVFDASSGLPGAAVAELVQDEHGTLYAGTGGGAARWTGESWQPLKAQGEIIRRNVRALLPLPDGTILLGSNQGIGEWSGDEKPLLDLKFQGPFRGADVRCFARDHKGVIWVGTSRGLARLERAAGGAAGTFDRFLQPVSGLPGGRILTVFARPDQPLLVSVEDEGLFEGEPGHFRRLGDDEAPGRRVNAVISETGSPEVLWMGTERQGAFCLRGGAFEKFGIAEGLADNRVRAILEDREGVLWFGTNSALTKRGPSSFILFDEADGFPADAPVFGMAESRDGAVWFSAWDAGVVRRARDGKARRFTSKDGLPDGRVVDVADEPKGGVVVATRRGIARIEGDRVRPVPLPSGISSDVRSLLVLPDERMLLGTRDDGLVILHPDGRAERVPTPLANDVTGLFVTKQGKVWVGSASSGAYGFEPGQTGGERITRNNGLPSNQVTSIFEDSSGTLWVSTDLGAWRRYRDGRTSILDRRLGLPDSYVYWVGEDREGGLWFGTNHGAARLPPNGPLKVFTSRDGLGSDECNEDGFFLSSTGDVYVGTLSASLYVGAPRPRRVIDPQVWLESVLADGRPLATRGAAVLPPGPGSLTFRFVSPSFTDENALRYRYRLVGLSPTWTESELGQGETTYGGLNPGEYRFEVLAQTADGRVSSAPAVFAFRVRPAWWQTWIALLSLAIGLAATIFGVVRAREAALVAARQRLEREVRERTEDLRRANERLAALAVTDELTGVANRRRLMEGLQEAMAFARRRDAPLSILLADLDRFKEVNDRLGHATGDEVLRRVAQSMAAALRTEDLLGRYGGDEFVAVLPGTGGVGAREAGERLRRALASPDLGLPFESESGPLTISVGIASYNRSIVDTAEMVRRADEALYRAKAAGRNRVAE
jgi:diguanylate cyclase (GGDEF)-like protein